MGNTLYVCSGSDCKKHKSENKKLLRGLGDCLEIEHVRCQKICKGPVMGVQVDGTLHWFRKLDPKSDLAGLQKALSKGKVSKALAQKSAEKRTGKLR